VGVGRRQVGVSTEHSSGRCVTCPLNSTTFSFRPTNSELRQAMALNFGRTLLDVLTFPLGRWLAAQPPFSPLQ
jgi:hypothetical protein